MSVGENLKNKKIICGTVFLLIVGATVFLWNNYQVEIRERPAKPIRPPWANWGKCGIEQCHGLDITCGPNVPEMCDAMYQVADDCRQYARCEKIGGKCQLVKEPEFDECRLCVERCLKDFEDDVLAASECESGCGGFPVQEDNTDEVIETNEGDKFSITLSSNPSTGYDWKVEFDSAYVQLIDRRYQQYKPISGSPAAVTFELLALTSGETEIKFSYLRPWEEQPPVEVRIFKIKIR